MEILGYIFLYLIVGVVLLPIPLVTDKLELIEKERPKSNLFLFVFGWPIIMGICLYALYMDGWKELKNYK